MPRNASDVWQVLCRHPMRSGGSSIVIGVRPRRRSVLVYVPGADPAHPQVLTPGQALQLAQDLQDAAGYAVLDDRGPITPAGRLPAETIATLEEFIDGSGR